MHTDTLRDDVRRALADPRDVAARLGFDPVVRQRGEGVTVRCPFHADGTPSCSLTRRDGVLCVHCFACKEGGDVFTLIAALRGYDVKRDFRRVLAEAAELARVAPPPAPSPPPSSPDPPPIPDTLFAAICARLLGLCPVRRSPHVLAYLAHRGLADEAARDGWGGLPPPSMQAGIVARLVREFGAEAMVASGLCMESESPGTEVPRLSPAPPPSNAFAPGGGHFAPSHPGPGAAPLRFESSRSVYPSPFGTDERRLVGGKHSHSPAYPSTPIRLIRPGSRLLIPWRDASGLVVGLQRRRLDAQEPRYITTHRRPLREPYGLHRLAKAPPGAVVVWVEGAVDALAVRVMQWRGDALPRLSTPLALPGVSAWSPAWARHGAGRVNLIATDADEAGDRCAEQMARDLRAAGAAEVRRVRPSAKDWGSVLEARLKR